LYSSDVHEISSQVAKEKDYAKALKLADENSQHSVNICARIHGYPSDPAKLKFFARNSKSPKLIAQALRYLGSSNKDSKIIADSLVNNNPDNFELIKEITANVEISNQAVITKSYEREKSYYLAKQIHDQDKILLYLQNESDADLKYALLENLTSEDALKKIALETQDSIAKEIVYWRLKDQKFISSLISKEQMKLYQEILRARLDMLKSENEDWFWKFCDRKISEVKSYPSISDLSDEEIKLRDFLNHYYSEKFKSSLKMYNKKTRLYETKNYILFQDTIRYAFDDRINDFRSSLSLDKINKNDIKVIPTKDMHFEIYEMKSIYNSDTFNYILKSLFNYSTISNNQIQELLRKINAKLAIIYRKELNSKQKYDVNVYPQIKLIFNKDMTRVKLEGYWTKDAEFGFYNFVNGEWKISDKNEGGYLHID